MKMPHATEFDSTLSLLRQGYELVPSMSCKLDSDIYEGRLLLRKTIFMTGEEAARLFYDNEKIESLKQITRQELLSAAKGWPHTSQVMLFPNCS